MPNMMLAWPNRADGAGLDQGAWAPTLPLANLLNPVLGLRARSSPSFSGLAYDSGWRPAYGGGAEWSDPAAWPEWEDDGFWSGGLSAEEIEGYRATLVHVLPADVRAPYWRVEIADAYNAAGYVEIGRLFLGPVWQPVHNLGYGLTLEWVSRSNVAEAAAGGEYFEPRQAYRVVRGALPWLDTAEALGRAFEFQRRMDIIGEFVC